MYYPRLIEKSVKAAVENFPAVAIIGSRQCGKTTLANHIYKTKNDVVYLDLERDADLRKLDDAEFFFSSFPKGTLFCIDEVQRKPELFPIVRYLVDKWNENGRFLFLGSASRDLLRQSSETLAGRISYKIMSPFLLDELPNHISLHDYLLKGGYPRSLNPDIDVSMDWRESFISTFLERDLLQWRNFTPATMRRLWMMLSHNNGQTANYSALASSLGVNNGTVKNYIDLLESTFMLYVVPPYLSNLGKRLVKAPKIYISDSGITCALLHLNSFQSLAGHMVFGSIWEQVVLLNLKGYYPNADFFYYRTSHGAEIDFVMQYQGKTFAIECKASVAPSLSKGNFNAIEDVNPTHSFVVCPANETYPLKKTIDVVSIPLLYSKINEMM